MRRGRRLRATGALLLWCGWLLLGAWHADTPHRFCPSHGCFEDVHASGGAPRGEHADLDAVDTRSGDDDGGHHLCVFSVIVQSPRGAGVVRVARLVPALAPPLAPRPHFVATPIHLLDVAPKASPPAISV